MSEQEQPFDPTSDLVSTLSRSRAGQRLWFWCAAEVVDPFPPVLLSTFAEDPDAARLLRWVARMPLSDDVPHCVGVGYVSEDGTLLLGGERTSREMLEGIARWTVEHVAENPSLARLGGVRLLELVDGEVAQTFDEPSLWTDVPRPVVPGTIRASAAVLAGLQEREQAWFWLTDRGPGGKPFLAVHPVDADPNGEAFAEQVKRVRRRSTGRGETLMGVLQVHGEGLVLTTEASMKTWPVLVKSLLRAWGRPNPALLSLGRARLVRIADGTISARRSKARLPPEIPDLSSEALELGKLGDGGSLLFWYTDQTEDGTSSLLLRSDPKALRAAVSERDGDGRSVRGRVFVTEEGRLEFRTKSAFPDFVPSLSRWVRAHEPVWPALKRLHGASFAFRDSDGAVHVQEDASAWS